MEFIGRKEEQESINYLLNREGYNGCIIYGRRRMGKTELIKHCVLKNNVQSIIFQCLESSEQENKNNLTDLISKIFEMKHLQFSSFMEAIEYLFELSINKKIVLVIDEYPYIRDLISGCDSKLQKIIDSYSSKSNLKLFLLGSSISTMEDVLSLHNPLYQRFNQSILLKQMDYYDSSMFYESFSNEDKIKIYSVFGGVPFYNEQIDPKQSVKENIIRIISGRFAGLKDFIDIYLKEELRKVNNANVVFDAIAIGTFHYTDILNKTHIGSSAQLTTILQKLIKMDLIEKVTPINEKTNKQKSRYRISDYCLRFYFNFIYRNSSAHNILDDDTFYNEYIKEEFDTIYVPNAFEAICKQFIIRINKKGLIKPLLSDIGTYWYDNPKEHKNGQFDVVGKSKDGYVFFECKFRATKITDSIIEKEIKQVNETTLKPIQYGFISKDGFDLNKEYSYLLYTLDDLYKKIWDILMTSYLYSTINVLQFLRLLLAYFLDYLRNELQLLRKYFLMILLLYLMNYLQVQVHNR